jgi:hypothetical protein
MSPRSSVVTAAFFDLPAGTLVAIFLIIATATIAARAQDDILALVNDEPITAQDVEQRSQHLAALSPAHTAPSKQEVLERLIDKTIVAPTAKRAHMTPSDFLDILNKSERGVLGMQEIRRRSSIEYRQ